MEPTSQNQPTAPMNGGDMGNGHKKVGPIIATLVIVLVLIIAALYLFASKVSQQSSTDTMADDTASQQATQVQAVTNTSDDLQSIQADLKTSTNGVDSQSI